MMHDPATTPIAIVGMACRLPGANDLDSYWRLLREGRSAVAPLPAERFDRELYFDPSGETLGKSYADLACLVDYPPLEELRSGLPAAAAETPEIAFLMMADVARTAVRHAGFDPDRMPVENTAVFIGHARDSGLGGDLAYSSYVPQIVSYLKETPTFSALSPDQQAELARELAAELHRQYPHREADGGPTLGAPVAAQCVARALGVNGPQMAVNAACASSLAALHYGVRALQQRRVDMAVVGGASYCHTETLVLFSRAKSLSSQGSSPFDAGADGIVVGEGYVALLLMRLEDAVAAGCPLLATVPGVGMSADGRGKSLWAPRAEGQVLAVRRAYQPPLRPTDLQYIEAHATSTQLGDATEVEAIREVFQAFPAPSSPISIGSVKGNIGHTLEAAGLAGVVKVVLSMQHGFIPPVINISHLNPRISWEDSPFYVPTVGRDWTEGEDGGPRAAGVNAFGIGGLNVHTVIQEVVDVEANYGASRKVRTTSPKTAPHNSTTHADAKREPVAITGMGVIAPGALDIDEFWDLLISARDPKQPAPGSAWLGSLASNGETTKADRDRRWLGGLVEGFEYDWRRHKIPPKQLERANPLQFMVLSAVEQAMKQAGLEPGEFDRQRTAVVVGTAFGGNFANELKVTLRLPEFQRHLRRTFARRGVSDAELDRIIREYAELLFARMPALLDETGSFSASSLASRITKTFDLMGGAVALDEGMASSMAALATSMDMLRSGDCDVVICIGAHQDTSPSRYEVLSRKGHLAGATVDGFFPGEGCAAFVLQRLSGLPDKGGPPLAIVRGVGAGDALITQEASRIAAARALAEAEVAAQDVAFLDMTGSDPAGGAQDLAGLAAAYGRSTRRQPLRLGSLTAQIGHLGAASGIVSLVKAVLALQNQTIPPSFPQGMAAFDGATFAQLLEINEHESKLPLLNDSGRAFAGVHSAGDGSATYHAIIERGEPVRVPKMNASNSTAGRNGQSHTAPPVVWFDATAARRERLSQQAAKKREAPPESPPIVEPPQAISPPSPPEAPVSVKPPAAASPPSTTADRSPGAANEVIQSAETPVPADEKAVELESFLVNFVIEQTGYPEELVELDADLEADLGIDSIKKAQLFGELNEYFEVEPQENLSLDDFPTLRHIRDFLLHDGRPSPAATAPLESPTQIVTEPQQDANPDYPPSAADTAPSREELESFLVNFVIEQTGYPEELVELDADLEADLGIDSIKKAQLFGELREYFDVQPDESLSLDDFPTLRHIRDFLLKNGQASAGADAPLEPAPVEPQAPRASVKADTGETDTGGTDRGPAGSAGPSREELESFLVNFVIEQTGYPEELVELDADLEADLGIDSIKKAQLFGELREYFDVQPDESLSLDDFPTLRHICNYLLTDRDSSASETLLQQQPSSPSRR